jgi:hypothetical protein
MNAVPPSGGIAEFTVYGPKALFAQEFAQAQQEYVDALNERGRAAWTHVAFTPSPDTSATAFVVSRAQISTNTPQPTRDIQVFVEGRGVYPLMIRFDLVTLPSGFGTVPDGELPARLLKWVGFKA